MKTACPQHRETARDVVTCGCGQAYRRAVRTVTFRDNDAISCRRCGAVLEEWNGMEIPSYLAITPANAAR